jgi:hypothetical protein
VLEGVSDESRELELLVGTCEVVVVDLNTPLDAANDEDVFNVEEEFFKQEAGIVKQQGNPVFDGALGSNTPL